MTEQRKMQPGAVCSDCGEPMTEDEYGQGRSFCCDADVVGEEEFGLEEA